MAENNNTTDVAIAKCNDLIKSYSQRVIGLIIIITIVFIAFSIFVYIQLSHPHLTNSVLIYDGKAFRTLVDLPAISVSKNAPPTILSTQTIATVDPPDRFIIYSVYLFCVILIGILTSFLKMQLDKIAKYEHYLMGFHRIRIAASNSDSKYDTEVRQALTHTAFSYKDSSKGNIESPVPGHPVSEITTAILNKILDSLEIKPKQ